MDKVFLSLFWNELFRLQVMQLRHSTAYHPQIVGQSEVVNRCLETYLRCFANSHPRSWSEWLTWAESWYNTSFHTSTKTTPFKVVYGRNPPPMIHYRTQQTLVAELDQQLQLSNEMLDELKLQLARAQSRMKKKITNDQRRAVKFEEGDLVYLKLQPYRQK